MPHSQRAEIGNAPPASNSLSLDLASNSLSLGPTSNSLSLGPASNSLSLGPASNSLSLGPASNNLSLWSASSCRSLGPASNSLSLGPASNGLSLVHAILVQTVWSGPVCVHCDFAQGQWRNRDKCLVFGRWHHLSVLTSSVNSTQTWLYHMVILLYVLSYSPKNTPLTHF